MSEININHNHGCDKTSACTIAEDMIDDLAQDYSLSIESDGQGNMTFTGSGISGTVTIDDDNINITAKLGFLMSAMKPVISNAIESKLHQKFT